MASFLDLPAELRNVVYHLALARVRDYDLRRPLNPSEEYNGILFASRQIRNEVLPIFWAENDFVIKTTLQTCDEKHPWDVLGQHVPTAFKHVMTLTLSFHIYRGRGPGTPREAREGNVWVCMSIIGRDCWIRVNDQYSGTPMEDWWPEPKIIKVQRDRVISEARVMVERLEGALDRKLNVELGWC